MKAILRSGFLALTIVLAQAVPVNSRPLDDGWAAYKRGNYEMALILMRPLAEQGNASAQLSLGIMYREARGVPQDIVQAYMWFSLAAAQGHNNAQLGRDVTASKMTHGQIEEARRMAREWVKKHQQPSVAAKLPAAAEPQAEPVPKYKTLPNGVIFRVN